MQLQTTAMVHIPYAPDEVFAYCMDPENLVASFEGGGPVPPIEHAEFVGGECKVGAVRRVRMGDGSVLTEEIVGHEPPARHRYSIVGFKAPLSFLATEGGSLWRFDATGKGTEVHWDATYELTSPIAYPIAALVVKRFVATAMQACLENLRKNMMARPTAAETRDF